jgi:hypothetical protein
MRRLLCFLLVAWSGQALAVKSLDFTIHQEYVSTRAMGMGNAFVAVADDHSAMFYNPALLALREDGQLRMFIRASTDVESLDLMDEIKAVQAKPKDEQNQAYSDLIVSHYGDNFHYRVPTIGGVWVRPKWGIAFIPADMSLDIGVHRQVGPMLNINLYLDSTLAYAYSDKINVGRRHLLTWGATAKLIHRVYVGEALSAVALADGSDIFDTALAQEGLGADLDLGSYWKPPVPKSGFFKFLKYMKPSFGLVGRNLFDYGFKRNFHFIDPNSSEPPKLQRRFDFGTKFDLPNFWVFDPKLAFDIRDMGHDNWTYKKGSHVGAEFAWKMYNWWKGTWSAGLNQGYWTLGFGAKMAFFQLEAVSYGEEVGTESVPQENRRYMLELALDF